MATNNHQITNKIENNKSLSDDLKVALLSVLPFKMNYCNAFKNEFNQPLDNQPLPF